MCSSRNDIKFHGEMVGEKTKIYLPVLAKGLNEILTEYYIISNVFGEKYYPALWIEILHYYMIHFKFIEKLKMIRLNGGMRQKFRMQEINS